MKKNRTIFERKYHLLWLFALIIFSSTTQAQEKIDVTGTITDGSIPILGVNILVQGTNRGTVSDFDGNYTIKVDKGEVLVFSSVGFLTQSVTVGEQTTINVTLDVSSQELEQVVVIGYGTQRKIEVTGAVTKLGSDIISKAPVSDLGESIQGQIAGVNIQANGRPGDVANIQIRGVGSLSPGSLGPLFVVDGVPFQGNPNIAPNQIESINVLKDGASASIYGTRAANGVILITTKRGNKGKLKVEYDTYVAAQNITSGIPLMNTDQQYFSDLEVNERLGTTNQLLFLSPNALDFDSDFINDIQNDNALIQNHSINVSGGSENLTLNLNGSYFEQDGVLINSGFDRLTTRITGEYKKDRLKIFSSIGFTEENREQEPFALYEFAISQRPFQAPIRDIRPVNGVVQLNQGSGSNPVLLGFLTRLLNNEDDRVTRTSNIAFSVDFEILDGLTYRANLGRNTFDFRRKFFRPQYLLFDSTGALVPNGSTVDALLDENFIFSERSTIENSLNYSKDFGKHGLKLLALTSYEQFDSKNVQTGIIGLPSNSTNVLSQGENGTTPLGIDTKNVLTGLLTRVQYNYDDRYLISGSYRRDGSSNFGPNNRFGDFFGFSVGWNVSEEPFFRNANIDAINNLKVRASWAEIGNQNIPPYLFSPQIETGVNYILGGELEFGQTARRFFDENIKWETKISKNIGLDLGMFSNKLNFTLDLYQNDREDLLLQERLPASAGANTPVQGNVFGARLVNAGNLTNKGIEIALSYRDQTKYGLKWGVSGTFTKNENEVTDLNGVSRGFAGGQTIFSQANNDLTTFLAEGFEAGAFFLIQNDGILKTQEQVDDYNSRIGGNAAQLGDLAFIDQLTVDTNGDGVPDARDGLINDDDRVYSGSGQPEFEAGLNINLEYKGFDFFIQNYLSYGAEVYNASRLVAYVYGRHLEQFNQWTPSNPTSDIPARDNGISNSVRPRSNFFLEDGSYLRIRNITLGYSIPEVSLPDFFSKIRIYTTAQNPFTFTDYTGFDPEVAGDGIFTRGVDAVSYPITRRFLFGLQLDF